MKRAICIFSIGVLGISILSPVFCFELYSPKKAISRLSALQAKFKKASQVVSSKSSSDRIKKTAETGSTGTGRVRAKASAADKAGNKNTDTISPHNQKESGKKSQAVSRLENLRQINYDSKEGSEKIQGKRGKGINNSERFYRGPADSYQTYSISGDPVDTADGSDHGDQTAEPSDVEIIDVLRESCGDDAIDSLSDSARQDLIDVVKNTGVDNFKQTAESFNQLFGEDFLDLFRSNEEAQSEFGKFVEWVDSWLPEISPGLPDLIDPWGSESEILSFQIYLSVFSKLGQEKFNESVTQLSQLFEKDPRKLLSIAPESLMSYLFSIDPGSNNTVDGLKKLSDIFGSEVFAFFRDNKEHFAGICESLYCFTGDVDSWYQGLCDEHGKDEVGTVFKDIGLISMGRFHLKDLGEIIGNRIANEDDGRPLAVLAFSEADHNGVYNHKKDMIHSLIAQGYRVMYYCAGTDNEFIDSMKDATHQGEVKASVLLIGGHGNQDSLHLGEGFWEDSSLSLADVKQFRDANLGSMLEPGGTVILSSCSTGHGEEKEGNLANILCSVFPTAGMIIAPTEVSSSKKIIYGNDGKIIGVEYTCPAYVAAPQRDRDPIIIKVDSGIVKFQEIKDRIPEFLNSF